MKSIAELRKHGEQAFDYWRGGQDRDVLPEFPAQELIEAESGEGSRDWPTTWIAAGGKLFNRRMIALKTDPIWQKISLFGYPFPPFDHFDNMDIDDIDRDESESLGLLDRKTKLTPQHIAFDAEKIK